MSQSLNILIVEDDPTWKENLKNIAKQLSHNVVNTVENSAEAIYFLDTYSVDLVFLDLHLKDEYMGGLNVMRHLLELSQMRLPHTQEGEGYMFIPCIYLSSIRDEELWERAEEFNYPFVSREKTEIQSLLSYKRAIDEVVRKTDLFTVRREDEKSFSASPVGCSSTYRISYKDVLWIEALGKHAILHVKTSLDLPYSRFELNNYFKRFKEEGDLFHPDLIEVHKSFIVHKKNCTMTDGGALYFRDVGNWRPTLGKSQITPRRGFDYSLVGLKNKNTIHSS